MEEHVEELWASFKAGRCFLKKVATKRFHPVVPKALEIWRHSSVNRMPPHVPFCRHLVNRMLPTPLPFAEEETEVSEGWQGVCT